MIYTGLVEYDFVSDAEVPFTVLLFLVFTAKAGDVRTIGQYKNYQTF